MKGLPALYAQLCGELSGTPQKHQHVEESRNLLRINNALKSIMSIGKMEKMDLIAINNRSLSNYSKVKRAEWTNRHVNEYKTGFLPDIKFLKLDSRRSEGETQHVEGDHETEICEYLIEEYINQIKTTKRYKDLADRDKIIEEACQVINSKMIAISEYRRKNANSRKSSNGNPERAKSFFQPIKPTKTVYRQPPRLLFRQSNDKNHLSVMTEAAYHSDLNRINKNMYYSLKKRKGDYKMFLRRIKQLRRMSTHGL